MPGAVLCQQADTALRLGQDEEKVALPQLLGKVVIGRHQVRPCRAQAQPQAAAQGIELIEQALRRNAGDARATGGFGRDDDAPAFQALPVMRLETGAGVLLELVRTADGGAPGHQAEAAVLGREQHLQLCAFARLFSQQVLQRLQCNRPDLAAFGAKVQAAEPLLPGALALAQTHTLGAEHGDKAIRR
ncbi:hypothetical protein D3C80_1285700 [compost metagenome]